MYKCAVTKRDSRPGDKVNKIVTATRAKVYMGWRLNEDTNQMEEVEVGRGWEIVSEISATEEGLKIWEASQLLANQ